MKDVNCICMKSISNKKIFHAIIRKPSFVENHYYDICNQKHMTTERFQSQIGF